MAEQSDFFYSCLKTNTNVQHYDPSVQTFTSATVSPFCQNNFLLIKHIFAICSIVQIIIIFISVVAKNIMSDNSFNYNAKKKHGFQNIYDYVLDATFNYVLK